MSKLTDPAVIEDTSRADTDWYLVHKPADARAKKQTGATLRAGLTPTTRTISTTSPLSGGGDLSANRTISITGVGGLTGLLNDVQKVAVAKNGGVSLGAETRLNFIEGTNVTLTIADDVANGEFDITIAAASGGAVTERWARVRKSANQTITSATDTAVTWDTEDADTDAFHDTVTNNTRMTIPAGQGGRYLLELSLRLSTLSSGQRNGSIKKNGTTVLAGATVPGISGVNTFINCTCVVNLAAGDYVEGFIYGTVGIDVLTDESSHFMIRKLS
jgi:hypothetical protein